MINIGNTHQYCDEKRKHIQSHENNRTTLYSVFFFLRNDIITGNFFLRAKCHRMKKKNIYI